MLILATVAAVCAALLLGSPAARLDVPSRSGATGSPPARTRRAVPLAPLSGISVAVATLAVLPLPAALPAAALVGWLVARAVARLEPTVERRRRERLSAQLPQVVDLMAICLTAGASPGGALGTVIRVVDEPIRGELAGCHARLALGADPLDVWRALAGDPQLGVLGRALVRAVETGASVSEALARLATEIRAERRAAVEAEARSIEVRASLPLGLCLLPAFVLVGIVPMVAGSVSLDFLR